MAYELKKIDLIDSNIDYFIDTEGNVFSSFRCKQGEPLRKLKLKIDKYRYCCIVLRDKENNKKYFTVHRLVALAFIPNDKPLENNTVNHINNIKTDNRVENLEWMSQADNNRYRFKMGYEVKGDKFTLFTEEDAKSIIELFYKENIPRIKIKNKYTQYNKASIESLLRNEIKCFKYLFDELNINQKEIDMRKGNVDEYRKQEIYNALYDYLHDRMSKKDICNKYGISRNMFNRYLSGDRLGYIVEDVKKDLDLGIDN